ncbi:hypothetical protein OC834_007717 [Tilletia horrida]|nr:hypothetical protein OC834_007717 [Tilletia horrida]
MPFLSKETTAAIARIAGILSIRFTRSLLAENPEGFVLDDVHHLYEAYLAMEQRCLRAEDGHQRAQAALERTQAALVRAEAEVTRFREALLPLFEPQLP